MIVIKLRVEVLALSPVAAGELDRVLHQLAHDGAAELVRELVPLLLLLHPLYHNLICSLAKTLKPVATDVVAMWLRLYNFTILPLTVCKCSAQCVLHSCGRVMEGLKFERSLKTYEVNSHRS